MTENSTRIFLRVKSPFHITRVKDVACHDGDTDGGDRSRRQVQLRRFHNTTSSKQIQYNMVWTSIQIATQHISLQAMLHGDKCEIFFL